MKKGLKCGLIAGTLACAFAFTTPMLVGCGDDDQKIKDLESQVTTLTAEKNTLTSEKATLTTEKTNLTNQVSSLTNEKTSLENENALMSKYLGVLSMEIGSQVSATVANNTEVIFIVPTSVYDGDITFVSESNLKIKLQVVQAEAENGFVNYDSGDNKLYDANDNVTLGAGVYKATISNLNTNATLTLRVKSIHAPSN